MHLEGKKKQELAVVYITLFFVLRTTLAVYVAVLV